MKILLKLFFFCCIALNSVGAQSSENRIIGFLTDSMTQEGMIGATVMAKNEATGFTTGTVTDHSGKFILENLPIGGPYSLTFTYVGYNTLTLQGYRLAQGDVIELGEIHLNTGSETLSAVVVTYNAFRADKGRLGTAKKITSETISKIPSATRNYKDLSSLSPLTRGTNSAGSKPGQMGYMLDGVSNRRNVFGDLVGGAFPVSMAAIQEFEVATNAYDVSNGRGGGALIKAVTKSGTNDFGGSVFGYYSGNALTGVEYISDANGDRFSEADEFTSTQFGFSFSGPIIKDKLHFFVTGDFYTKKSPYTVDDFDKAGSTLEEAEKNLSITKSNMDQVVSILEGNTFQIPVPASGKQYGTITTKQITSNFLGKLDYRMNDKNLLTFRYNYHTYHNPRKRKGLLSTQYEENSYDHSVLLSLRTELSSYMFNDLKVSFADVHRPNELIFNRAPVGRVNVTSKLADGNTRSKWIYWGNQYWIPEIISERNVQIVNNLKFQVGNVRYTAGIDLYWNQIRDKLTHYQQGEFFYNSIEDLMTNTPYRYERKTPVGNLPDLYTPSIFETGIYGQMETNLTKDIEMQLGLRWDATMIPVKPTYNAVLETELGVRNDVTPFDASGIQPRLNLIWDVNGQGNDIVKIGAGRFVNQFTTQVLTMTHIDNGVDFKYVVVDATLPKFDYEDLPAADWPAFFEDFDKNVPGEAYLNELVSKGLFEEPASLVVMLDEKLKTPKTWKFNANYYHYFNDWLNVGLGFYYNRTIGNYYFENINLKDKPEFTLPLEGNREVYVPIETLEGQNQAKYDFAKKSDKFTQVLKFTNADWPNTYMAMVAEININFPESGSLNFSYTRGASKGGTRYNSGNTREYHFVGASYHNWGDAMQGYYDTDDLRNKFILAGISPTYKGFTISATVIGEQAQRFSAGMGGNKDILGVNIQDPGNNSVLPFVFDPNDPSTPEYLADGINSILTNDQTDERYKEYLRAHFGDFAAPNGGIQPMRFTGNVSVVKSIKLGGSQRIELRADIFNFFNLLNRKKGGYDEISNTNLYNNITGFDEESKQWIYQVNTNAGQSIYRVSNPYEIHVGLKYEF